MRSSMAMRLLPQSIAMILLLVLFSFGTAQATRHYIVVPKLRELAAQADRKDLRRALLAIDAKKLQLTAITYENAIANSTYEYFAHRTPGFIDDNFPTDTLIAFNIDLVALFDRNNAPAGHRLLDGASAAAPDQQLPLADIAPYLINVDKARPHAPIFDSGLMASTIGPQLYAIVSVMRADTDSEARGSLLLGMPLDEDFLRDIEETAQLGIALAPLTPEEQLTARVAEPEDIYRDETNRIAWYLADNRGRPVVKLLLTLPPRDSGESLWALPLLFAFVVGALGGIAILIVFHQTLIKPILHIGDHLQRVRAGADYSLRLNSRIGNELGDLSRHIDALVTQVQKQQDQLHAQSMELQRLSYNDGMTGLANRRRFDQALAISWALAQRNRTSVALIMCDVDYFKPYNDHYGHLRGDDALRKVAAVIKRVVPRQSDLAARYGGEEFAILLPDTGETGAVEVAERIQHELEALAIPHAASRIGSVLTLSLGIAAIEPVAQQQPRELVQRADEALYAAKAAGRNRIMRASQVPE